MKKFLALILALLMVFALVACGAESDSDLAYIEDKGTLVIGITEYPPISYRDENGEWTGFDTDFAIAVCEKLGVEPEFVEIDWDNKVFELNSKSIDCVWNGMTLTNEVLEAMNCSVAYINNSQVVVMKSDVVGNYTTVESLASLTFAVEAGSAGEAAVADNFPDAVCTAVLTQSDAVMEVASGSSQACVIDVTMARAITVEGGSYDNLAIGIQLTTEEYGIGFRKESDVTAKVNSIIADLLADGTLQQIADKYDLGSVLITE